MTESDHSSSCPESHRSILATTSLGTSPWPTSAPELGAATKVEGTPKAGSCKDKDALDPPSVNRASHANTMATSDLPPQLPLLLSPTDIAIAGPSQRELDAAHTGDHPPHALHSQYDIV